ncbi:MAG TPA: hypothetical protein PLL30_02185 [Candidatus Krumholzibacteria bacterium]|nr:hypothetical protein [Candidatus Krumholzibacteria bacterium]HPD70576.1 hypothetical protein [Candidatus Krumholzibacteria bacterium]HRY39724.1 hypothetical protein [Candidatus Krumholzibacteria bacterium]
MSSSFRLAISVTVLPALLVAIDSPAQPVAANCTVQFNSPHPLVSMYLVPNGAGTPLSACRGPGGAITQASITVIVRDANSQPVAGLTNRDVRIAQAQPGINWCPDTFYPPPFHGPNCADADTDAAGVTTFTQAYHGGGIEATGSQVWVREANGQFAAIPGLLPVLMNSFDNNGDGAINLSDIANFAADMGTPNYRSDFNYDGIVNLSDIVICIAVLGVTCP